MRGVLLLALLMTSCAAPAAAPVTAGPATRSVLTADPSRASAATPTPAATASASTGATASATVSVSATASATPRAAPAPQAPPAPRVVRSPFTFKDREGWVLGYQDGNIVLRPERGGALRLPVPIYGSVWDITFADILHGWALGRIVRGPQTNCQHAAFYPPCRDVILGTADGGRSWSLLLAYETTGITGETFRALQFTDARHGWAIQFRDSCSPCRAELIATDDGGVTWNVRWRSPDDDVLDRVRFVDAQHGWAIRTSWWTAGESGSPGSRIVATNDGGRTWSTQLENVAVADVTALDATHAWAVANRAEPCTLASCPVRLYRTTDGKTWALAADGIGALPCAGRTVWRPAFLDADRGVLASGGRDAGDPGGVLITRNGGSSWDCTPAQPGTANAQFAPLMMGGTLLIVTRDAAASDHLFSSPDLGNTWEELPLSLPF